MNAIDAMLVSDQMMRHCNTVFTRLQMAGISDTHPTHHGTGSALRLATALRVKQIGVNVYDAASNGRGDCAFSCWAKLFDYGAGGAARVRQGLSSLLDGVYLPSDQAHTHPAFCSAESASAANLDFSMLFTNATFNEADTYNRIVSSCQDWARTPTESVATRGRSEAQLVKDRCNLIANTPEDDWPPEWPRLNLGDSLRGLWLPRSAEVFSRDFAAVQTRRACILGVGRDADGDVLGWATVRDICMLAAHNDAVAVFVYEHDGDVFLFHPHLTRSEIADPILPKIVFGYADSFSHFVVLLPDDATQEFRFQWHEQPLLGAVVPPVSRQAGVDAAAGSQSAAGVPPPTQPSVPQSRMLCLRPTDSTFSFHHLHTHVKSAARRQADRCRRVRCSCAAQAARLASQCQQAVRTQTTCVLR